MLKNAICLFVLAILVLIVFLPSYTRMQDLKQKNARYAEDIKRLTKERENLLEERRKLTEDPAYLEKVAREEMGLIKEGEVIYRMVPGNREAE